MLNSATALRFAAASVHGSEGCRLRAYLDKLARQPVWTIGYGTTRIRGLPVHAGDTCTEPQAAAWAADDMAAALGYVAVQVEVELNDWQAAALTALCYNVGFGTFRHSTVLAALNEGHYRTAADCILEYDHAGGVRIPGLTARRQRERALFLVTMPDRGRDVVAATPPLSAADRLNQQQIDKGKPA